MIPVRINNCNTFKLKCQEYQNFVASNDFSNLVCPICDTKGDFTRNTSYVRNLIYIEDESFDDIEYNSNLNSIDTKLKITVIRCNSCGKYHALLPTFILPYHIYSAYFIMISLQAKLIKNLNMNKLLESLGISHKLFYYWNRIFLNYIPSSSTVLDTADNSPPNILKLIIFNFENFLSNFYEQFKIIFFLNYDNHKFY